MLRKLVPIVLFWAFTSASHAGVYHDPDLTWQTIESTHFRIHYHNGEAALAQRFWPKAETIYNDTVAFLSWKPRDKIDVVLTDEFDVSNGYTRVFPYNSVILFISAPDETNSLEEYDDWIALVFRHEFLHVVHLDKAAGAPLTLRHVFGRYPLLFPNAYQPRWIIEGLATYAETDTEKSVGRGQSAYFDMLMRMESLSGFKPIRRVNQPIGSWPAGTTPYLYGVYFFEFIRDTYGEKAVKQLVTYYSDNLIPFRINSNSAVVLHKELPQIWDEYRDWLKRKYDREAARIKQAGLREGKDLTHAGYLAGPLQTAGDKIYFYQFTGKSHAAINVIDGQLPVKKLLDVNPGTRFTLHLDKGILITQPEICHNARLYFDIYRADLNGKHFKRLTQCARYRSAVWTGKGDRIVAVHNELGNNRLDLLDDKGQRIETLWQGDDGIQIGQLTSNPAQAYLVASVWRSKLGWNLEKFDLQMRQWTALTQDRNIETQPQFSPDGQSIYYSANKSGVYNLYKYELDNGTISQLSNVIGGAFYPAIAGKRLAYISYSEPGFNVAAMDMASLPSTHTSEPSQETAVIASQIENATRTSESDKQGNLTAVTKDTSATLQNTDNTSRAGVYKGTSAASNEDHVGTNTTDLASRPYSPWSSLLPRYWGPVFTIDEQRTELGVSTSGFDVLQRHIYSAAASYDFKNKQAVGQFDYIYDGLTPIFHVGFSRENSIYLDNNKNTSIVRASDDSILEANLPFLSLEHAWSLRAALIKQYDHDVWTNGISSLPDIQDDIAAIGLRYVSAKRYPLSVSRNDGRELRLLYEDSDAYGDSYRKGQVTVAEWREFIPLGGEHVLALRVTEGRGKHNPKPFRLGGIQNQNTVLSSILNGEVEPLFNKRDYSLRGYSEGHAQLTGKSIRLISAEYRFPIKRIERGLMVPPIGINQLHGTLFYDAGGVWNTGNGPEHYYTDAGFELGADLDVFYNIRLRTSLGFAKGFDKTLGENKVYLRIGSEF